MKDGRHHTDKDRLGTVFIINVIVFVAEIIIGYSSGSLSMISDSFHVSLHVVASLVAFFSEYEFSWISPEKIKFWSAGINIALFFPLAFMIASEATVRWHNPPVIKYTSAYFLIAFFGLGANLFTVFILKPDKHAHHSNHNHAENKNRFILYIHMIFDSIGSVIVIAGAFEIIRTSNYAIDPISSLVLAGIIVFAAIWMSWELIHGHSH